MKARQVPAHLNMNTRVFRDLMKVTHPDKWKLFRDYEIRLDDTILDAACQSSRREVVRMKKPQVIFVFKSQEDKEFFLAGLCDGWGENECSLKWPNKVDLFDAPEVLVEPFRDDE